MKPETLVGWHPAIVRRHWRLLSRRKPDRPPAITPEMEQRVVRIARENLWMGYSRIAGEMCKLGFSGSGRSSVKRIPSGPETRLASGMVAQCLSRHSRHSLTPLSRETPRTEMEAERESEGRGCASSRPPRRMRRRHPGWRWLRTPGQSRQREPACSGAHLWGGRVSVRLTSLRQYQASPRRLRRAPCRRHTRHPQHARRGR